MPRKEEEKTGVVVKKIKKILVRAIPSSVSPHNVKYNSISAPASA